MNRLFGIGLFLALGLVSDVSPLTAQPSCGRLGLPLSELYDGQLFYSPSGDGKWISFASFSNITSPRRMSFVYIVREAFLPQRSGVIVIKSQKIISDPRENGGTSQTVKLVRRDPALSKGNRCSSNSNFGEHGQFVTSQAYDDYHDYGFQKLNELKTLKNFHTKYPLSGERCKASDDTSWDNLFDWRSNRSQFSFDPNVVAHGMFSQLSSLLVGKGVAASARLANQRVAIKSYVTEDHLACVQFSVSVSGPDHILRINDLEARVLGIRPIERVWSR